MANNLLSLIKEHGGKWVALKPDSQKILASGKDAKKVYKKAQEKGVKIPTLFKVPSRHIPYIG